jgi:hypothetical protein
VVGAVRDLTDAVLAETGLRAASFSVTGDGRIVSIDVPRRAACTLTSGEPAQIERRIDGASQIVDRVTLQIHGWKPAADSYLRRHCRKTAASPGAGKVVYSAERSGVFGTRSFRVRSDRWTIEYDNASTVLQVFVYKRGKLRSVPVNVKVRGGGKRVLDGAGRYTLRIASTGKWRVRVRDGV